MRQLAVLLLLLPGFGNIACRGEEVEPYSVDVDGDRSPIATGETAHVSVVVRSTERIRLGLVFVVTAGCHDVDRGDGGPPDVAVDASPPDAHDDAHDGGVD